MPTGIEPVDRVIVMENHDAAYRVWRNAGVRQRVLVHIDAHHDMWWVRDGTPVTIADFICPALKEDLVREVVWVVPDATWETAKARKHILRHLEALSRGYPKARHARQIGDGHISTLLLGKSLRVVPLSRLPRFEESVLLDIDVDFLVIPRVSYGERDRHGPVPWCWPDGLLARLHDCNVRTDLATIVYSVEGGYTPLKWKYLGDELALRLQTPDPNEPAVRGMALMREAALAAHCGDPGAAAEKYQQARGLLPTSAAPCFHLAHLYLQTARTAAAQQFYQQALALDPSYRTAFNSAGLCYHWDRRFADARQEHLRMLALDPQDAYAHFGLGRLAARPRNRWGEAEASLRTALALDGALPDAWRVLGEVLAKQKRHDEAILAYQHSLKLELAGHKPLAAPIATQSPSDSVLNPRHFAIHVQLARLYEATGAITQAITGYRLGITGGHDNALLRFRLARLYLKQKQWRQAAQQTWQAVKAVPIGAWKAGHWAFRRVRRAIRPLFDTLW